MSINIIKHWEDVETFDVPVIDKRGDIFVYNGEPWVMTLCPPDADDVKRALRKNADESASLRARRQASERNNPLPDEMSERHIIRIIQATHIAWKNAPIENAEAVDFKGDEFAQFLKDEPWYVNQWQNAWTDRKNFTRLKDDQPKKNSSNGAKSK